MDALPQLLVDAVREQRAILFLGAGASIGAPHPKGVNIPLGDALRDQISEKFLNGELKNKSLVAVAAMAANDHGLTSLQTFIRDLFLPFTPADFHLLIPSFRWKALVTTNFDLIIERAYEDRGNDAVQHIVKTVKDGDQFDSRVNQTSLPVGYYKLHGCIDYFLDEDIPLVLGQEQYASYETHRRRFYARLRDLAYEYPIIFCGYSISDPHIQQLIFDLTDKKIARPWYFYVAPDVTDIETRYWSQHKIQCLKGSTSELLKALDAAIPMIARKLPPLVGGGTLSIRKHYRIPGASESDALKLFLENDVDHLHGSMPVEYQDPVQFYKGYDTGWGCISQNLDVRRAVCDSILVDAVLASEDSRKTADLYVLKGAAGNGKTVALKRVAWDAGVVYDQMALWVTTAAGLNKQIVREIYDLTGKRCFFFVDRIALLRNEVRDLLEYCRSEKIPITIVGAERDNEWNFYCEHLEKYVRQEFTLGYMSGKAIRLLLELLERHRALGLLANQTIDQRIDAFTQRAEKQLLVALHETTLGLPFEKIVLDEFNGIYPAEARQIYLQICALHQFGAKIRAGLISRVSGVSFVEFGQRFLLPLKNVVMVEDDEHGKDYFYSSRHRHVAELVFNQVLAKDEDKFELLSNLMGAINVDYSSDSETWRRLIRGRSVAHMFLSVELGRLLYDRAQELTPNDPFILHQRAVFEMAHAGGSLFQAEKASKAAADMLPANRSISHTQAEIARRQADTTEDALLKQSLRRFARDKLGISGSRFSEYDFGTRARLALDELREFLQSGANLDSPTLLQATKEAQIAVQQGLVAYPESAELLAVEADLHQLFEHAEKARVALEKAFNLNPRLDWLAIRLARIYVRDGKLAAAEAALAKCLENNPGSKVGHLQMALLAKKMQRPPSLVMDHLARSFSQGDNNYEAQFWYARELFLQHHVVASKAAFERLNEIAPGRFRSVPSAFDAELSGTPINHRGVVVRREEGYAFINFPDFGVRIFASRGETPSQSWASLQSNMAVIASIAFNRRGPRATNIRPS
jgi:tetratricopeptide (TPR) repeat protein